MRTKHTSDPTPVNRDIEPTVIALAKLEVSIRAVVVPDTDHGIERALSTSA